MIERLKVRKTLAAAGAAALAAMSLGGVAIAQSGDTATPKAPVTGTASPQAPETAKEQAGPENSPTDRDNVQNENGKDDATEKSEAAEGPEVPGDDGPGGHADEPGNPNADHQFQGRE